MTKGCYKVRQLNLLSQIATKFLQIATGITNYDNITNYDSYYKLLQLLQIATEHTYLSKWSVTT